MTVMRVGVEVTGGSQNFKVYSFVEEAEWIKLECDPYYIAFSHKMGISNNRG